jgi:hypothetical protein
MSRAALAGSRKNPISHLSTGSHFARTIGTGIIFSSSRVSALTALIN